MFKILQAAIYLIIAANAMASPQPQDSRLFIDRTIQLIERKHHVKVGIYAMDTNSGKNIAYNADDRFPFQSTSKLIAVSALLAKDNYQTLLNKEVVINPKDILFWDPISIKYINKKVTLNTLAEGAISYSDNTAINMIIRELGGLDSINTFAYNLGNQSFKMMHYEDNLNSTPSKNDDTSTPKDMALSVQKILFGGILTKQNKGLLIDWMRNSTTGYNRIRAGVPLGWAVAEKTGSGSYGVANDIGIAWSPNCKPIVLSIYTIGQRLNAKPNNVVIKEVTQAIFNKFAQYHVCHKMATI